jgi:hypothetical protein
LLETRRLSDMGFYGQGESTCTGAPAVGVRPSAREAYCARRASRPAGLHRSGLGNIALLAFISCSHAVGVQVDPFENPNFETRISHFRFKGWVIRRF